MQHLGNSTANRNADLSQRIINQTVLNPGWTLRSEAQKNDSNEIKLISEIDSIWANYWGGHLYAIHHSFFFPNNHPHLRLWLSWNLPDITQKMCPYRFLKSDDVVHLPRGPRKLYEMRLVMEVFIIKIESIPLLNKRCRDNK